MGQPSAPRESPNVDSEKGTAVLEIPHLPAGGTADDTGSDGEKIGTREAEVGRPDGFRDGGEVREYDEEASRRLVRRQDIRILPLAAWVYLLCYLDRSNIGNAKVAALSEHHDMLSDLHTTNFQYTVALMLFFVAYIIFETPGNYFMKTLRPSRWVALTCLTWGVVTCCIGATKTYSQLAGLRFLLGAIEASLFPGLTYLLTFWYRPEERSIRVAFILASATLAGAFGGAMATGITYLDGKRGIYAWRWIFIIEGLPSIVTAFVVVFCFPDFPERASWLSPTEKALSAARLAGDNSSKGDDKLTWSEAKKTLTDWRLYAHYLAYIGISAPFSSLSLFAPTIVKGMGYDQGVQANLFTVPPYAVAWVVTLTVSFWGDHYNRRGIASASAALVAAVAFAIEGGLPGDRYTTRYGLLILATSGAFACIPPLLGWLSSNVRGTMAATLAIPLNVSFGGIGQIVGVWIYKANEAPRYPTGHFVNFAFLLMTSVTCVLLVVFYSSQNKKIVARSTGERLWVL